MKIIISKKLNDSALRIEKEFGTEALEGFGEATFWEDDGFPNNFKGLSKFEKGIAFAQKAAADGKDILKISADNCVIYTIGNENDVEEELEKLFKEYPLN